MPSPQYTSLVNVCANYLDRAKAEEVLGRQLAACKATPDTFSQDNLKAIVNMLLGSITLYVADKAKREELVAKIKSMA